jgi:predicted porin
MVKSMWFVVFSMFSGVSYAQSSVTLYGSMDAGVNYTNRVANGTTQGANLQFVSGSADTDKWGLKGVEDLGGQEYVNFVLQKLYVLSTGEPTASGVEFGPAYVGLSGPWGALTIGRQYDFFGVQMGNYCIGGLTPAGILALSLPANAAGGFALDNRIGGDEVSNSVKYLTPKFVGLSAGAMFGFGNTPGSVASSSSSAFVANYEYGAFSASIAYFGKQNVTSGGNSRELGGAASYTIGSVHVFGLLTDVRLTAGNKLSAATAEAGLTYQLAPDFTLGGGAQFQRRNNNLGSANQFTLTADYFLSKSTDVYVVTAMIHDHALGAEVDPIYGGLSGTDAQTAIRFAIRHRF